LLGSAVVFLIDDAAKDVTLKLQIRHKIWRSTYFWNVKTASVFVDLIQFGFQNAMQLTFADNCFKNLPSSHY
jgi:hypothetical protein